MPDITFYSWLILSNIWLAASHLTNNDSSRIMCNIFGAVWLALAIIGKLVG